MRKARISRTQAQVEAAKSQLQAAQSQFAMAGAKLAREQALYDYSKITAPFAHHNATIHKLARVLAVRAGTS